MEIVDNKVVLFKTRAPEKFAIIPRHKVIETYENGGGLVAVKWALDEMRVLRNLGVKKAPSPILGHYDWPGRYKPAEHQKDTAAFLTMHRRCFVFNEAGTMKTMSALWAADYLMQLGHVRRVLIICPVSIMHSAWMGDIGSSIIHRSAIVAHHSKASRRIEMVQGDYEFVITNYEGLHLIGPEIRNDGRFDLIIVDECSAYSNMQTDRWKALNRILQPNTILWMMTGTPAAQSPLHAYGLAKLVCPERAPKFYGNWRDKVMLKVTNFKWVPKPNAKEQVFDLLQPAIRYTKAQCLDLPPVVTQTREVDMTPQQKKYYDTLKTQMAVTAAGERITAVNAGVAISKLLQISCIAYNTPVLTDSGWVPIQRVRRGDLVWDGVEFVQHDGLLERGRKQVLSCFGVDMTADHRVLTKRGWVTAEECLNESGQGLNRAEVRLPDGAVSGRYERWDFEEGPLALQMRLRQGSDAREPVPTNEASHTPAQLRVPARQYNACNDAVATVSDMGRHATEVHGPERQRLQKLRSEGDHGVQGLGGEFRGVLEGHGRNLLAGLDFGPQGQPRGVLAGELSVGDAPAASQQHTEHCLAGYTAGPHDVGAGRERLWSAGRDARCPTETAGLASSESVDYTRSEEVFDIANCGPRNRFVVLGADGEPLIVHNCGAAYTDNKEVVEFDAKPRLKVVKEAIDETDRKVIIFAMFRSSMDSLHDYLTKEGYTCEQIHGGVSAGKRGRIIQDFQNTDNVRVLIMQPQATAHGITLTAADTVVFFGPLMSVELYIQCIARADRKGQTSSSVRVIHVQSSPIEKKLFKAMGTKVSDHSLLTTMYDSEIKT